MDRLNRLIIATYQANLRYSRFGLTVKGRRVHGALAFGGLLLTGFVIWMTWPVNQSNWLLPLYLGLAALFACSYWMVNAVLTFIPQYRSKMEALEAKIVREDEETIQQFTDAAKNEPAP